MARKYDDRCITGHTVSIHERGGRKRVAALTDIAHVEWGRRRDDFSAAKIVLTSRSCAIQAEALAMIEPRFHELVIHRGERRVWEGPIREVRWFNDRAEIVADDVGAYLNHTPCSIDWPGPDGGGQIFMTERIKEIITHELTTPYTMDVGLTAPDLVTVPRWENLNPTANILPHLDVRSSIGVGGLLTTAEVEAFEMMVGEHLVNLARGGLDFTIIGRSIIIWDSGEPLAESAQLSDADFLGELVVIAAGGDHASIGHVVAPGGDDDDGEPLPPAVGNAGGPDPFYGVWTTLLTREDEEGTDTPSQEALNTQARRLIAGRTPVPTEIIAQGGLRLSASLTVDDLVPGTVMPVRAVMNLRTVSQRQVLDQVLVTENADGESISVNLVPAGALEAI